MRILGICHDVWICSAALVRDGQVESAVCEERLDRRKLSRVFPTLAIERVLREAGCEMSDVDEIAVAWNPSFELETVPSGYLTGRVNRAEHLLQVPAQLMRLGTGKPSSMLTLEGIYRDSPPVTYVNHYDAHIGASYFLSPYEESALLVMDGRGERHTGLLAVARGAEIEPLQEVLYPHSLGLFYGAVTQHLGFTPDSDEWKVMALASYADANNEFLEPLSGLITVADNGTFELDLDYFSFFNLTDNRMFSDKFVRLFGPPRERNEPLGRRHERMAAAMQHLFEQVAAQILKSLHRQSGMQRLALSGGCFMNSVFNGLVTDFTPFDEVFISSCPDDSGTSVGAALFLEATRTGKKPPPTAAHNYWGPEYSDEDCFEAAQRYRLPNVEVVDDPAERAAADLADGAIIGWFQGRMEFGQRALGNRSILLDPRREDGKDVVNAAVKYRESFRPFAPAILAERVADWFECESGTKVRFMERVLPFKKERAKEVPSVVHIDGTGRLQTVDELTSPRYHALISHFEKLTGVPIVLNTSFNLNGEAIVCSPEDAIRTFFTCGLDVLYLGNVRVAK